MANEKRMIDANACLQDMCKRCNIENEGCHCEPADCFIYDVIANATTVDAVEVAHGRWGNPEDCVCYQCSNCGEYSNQHYGLTEAIFFKYCPQCGAKMDGVNDDG